MMWQSFLEKAVWFLKLYVREYRYLVAFLACFVFFYILFMHWMNIRFFRVLREPVAIICLIVEIIAIAWFTIFFREQGDSHTYELELFWSYRKWILEGSVTFGLEILNNIVLFFPFGFILTDALRRCPFWAVLLASGAGVLSSVSLYSSLACLNSTIFLTTCLVQWPDGVFSIFSEV